MPPVVGEEVVALLGCRAVRALNETITSPRKVASRLNCAGSSEVKGLLVLFVGDWAEANHYTRDRRRGGPTVAAPPATRVIAGIAALHALLTESRRRRRTRAGVVGRDRDGSRPVGAGRWGRPGLHRAQRVDGAGAPLPGSAQLLGNKERTRVMRTCWPRIVRLDRGHHSPQLAGDPDVAEETMLAGTDAPVADLVPAP